MIGKSIFPQSTVFSFEMNPESYIALHKNINLNKHLGIPATQCLNVGLSNKTNLQERVFTRGFTLREDRNSENLSAENSSVIDIISIDDFCRISGFQPNLIKIDVEGYQAKIIPGSIDTIEKAKPIIILEFDSQKTLKYFNTTNKQITKPLFDLKYQCYWCKNQRGFEGKFQQLDYNNFSQEHEQNSLSIFMPN
ncbi:MAG: FkbM family methyltransferase [Okeania sp. SIO3C4]|nr:FkbM family methyltransferase [Okeania sp. SIO3C4]